MATVVAVTSIKFTDEQKKQFIDKTVGAVCESLNLSRKFRSIMLIPLGDNCYCENVKGQITFFVYSAPNKTVEQKRELVKRLNQVMLDLVGYQGVMKVVVIIKEHSDENCGVDGILRVDA